MADQTEFEMGMKEEREHNDVTGGDPAKIAMIVNAHLEEDPHYYTKLKAAMKEAKPMDRAVKFLDEEKGIIEGCGIPYGGPMAGKDLTGEYFTAKTNLCLDWFPQEGRPVLYHHGLDDGVKDSPIGRQIDREQRDGGTWVKAQLNKSHAYWDMIKGLIKSGKLFWSSGAVPHLVEKAMDGEIKRWPWVEMTLTPTPAHPGATVDSFKAIEHLKAVHAPKQTIKNLEAMKMEADQLGNPTNDPAKPAVEFVKEPTQVKDDLSAIGGQEGGTPGAPAGLELNKNADAKFGSMKCQKCGFKIVLPPEVVDALEKLGQSVAGILQEHELTQAGGEQPNPVGTGQETPQPPTPPVGGQPSPGIEPPPPQAPPPGVGQGMGAETHAEAPPEPEVQPPTEEPKKPNPFAGKDAEVPKVKEEKAPPSAEVAVPKSGDGLEKPDKPQDLNDVAVKALLDKAKQNWTEGLKALMDQQKSAFEVTIKSLQEKVETLEKLPRSVPPHRYAGAKSYNPHMGEEIGPEDRAKVIADLAEKATDPAVKAFLGQQSAMDDVKGMMKSGPQAFRKA